MIERNYITPEILSDIQKINDDCIRMHLAPPPVVFVECRVEPIDGGEPTLIHKEKANSWTRNYYNHVFATCAWAFVASDTTFGEGHLNNNQTSGVTVRSYTTYRSNFGDQTTVSGAANTALGIVVGTGNGAESLDSITMGTLCANGTGVNQFAYQAGTAGNASYNSGTKKWTQAISRVLNNNSANAIVVTETGIIGVPEVAGQARYTLLERNLLSSPVSVPAAYKLTVTYTFEMTFPG